MKRSVVLIVVLASLMTAACGSNVPESQRRSGSGNDGAVSGAGTTNRTDVPMVGTLELGCGVGDGQNTDPGVQGVTADSITIGVMADLTGPRPGLGEHTVQAMRAFVELCNEHGGINGRLLELREFDTQLLNAVGAATQACAEVFATVGDGVVFDNEAAQIQVDCNQVSLPGWSGTAEKSLSDLTYMAQPGPGDHWFAAPGRYLADTFPDAVTAAQATYVNGVVATESTKARVQESYRALHGFEYRDDVVNSLVETSWNSIVSGMRDEGIRYVYPVTEATNVAAMLQAMDELGWRPDVIDLNGQYYTHTLIEAAGASAEGVHVSTTQKPFEEAEAGDATSVYLDYLERVSPGARPDYLGVLEFSSALLFAQAMSSLGNDISTETLDAALSEITEWDGGGLHVPTNPGENTRDLDCYMFLTVQDGEFVREYPATREEGDINGFRCYDDTIYEITEYEIAEGAG